ncbi:rRNA maturation RNase YbeY [Salinarimonas ramus]|uniref:Endoribonuclease YbeY n=1 Tax=Salinarimonas ramus TaxID=690164 RepID=A0A917Q819_9HYPH|nr:rRNA maturation RNase YbeY [Salinarimonas ramus]GGK34262.1 endoribonuclease YbeY [Salinarimonas ramus]
MSAVDLTLEITREAGAWDTLEDVEGLCVRAAEAALVVAGVEGLVSLELLLTDDDAIRAINLEWRNLDKPTNVLSFPAAPTPGFPGPRPLGDVVLAYETLAREAEEEGKSLADHAAHLLAHGVLHCLGYDHDTDAAAEEMEALETRAMALIGIADPYGGAT